MANEVHLIVGAATDVGTVRTVNEDAHGFLRCAAGDLLVVCDGMGGHAAGDLASRTALDAIAMTVAQSGVELAPEALLERAALAAHEAVRTVAAASQANAGMGTTCVMALVRGNQVWVANVGDSRCYHVRGGQLRQLSVDHTKARKLLDAGIITPEQFANHPEKGVLSQAIGQRNPPQPSVSRPMHLQLDDYLVLCSDGVYDSTETDMAALTSGANPNYAAHDLVAKAVQRDGKDNATAVIGRYVQLDRPVQAAPVRTPTAVAAKPAVPWGSPLVAGGLALALLAGFGLGWLVKPAPEAAAPSQTADGTAEGGAADNNAPDAGAQGQEPTPDIQSASGEERAAGEGGADASAGRDAGGSPAADRADLWQRVNSHVSKVERLEQRVTSLLARAKQSGRGDAIDTADAASTSVRKAREALNPLKTKVLNLPATPSEAELADANQKLRQAVELVHQAENDVRTAERKLQETPDPSDRQAPKPAAPKPAAVAPAPAKDPKPEPKRPEPKANDAPATKPAAADKAPAAPAAPKETPK